MNATLLLFLAGCGAPALAPHEEPSVTTPRTGNEGDRFDGMGPTLSAVTDDVIAFRLPGVGTSVVFDGPDVRLGDALRLTPEGWGAAPPRPARVNRFDATENDPGGPAYEVTFEGGDGSVWWQVYANGVEFGWTIEELRDEEDVLSLAMRLDGADRVDDERRLVVGDDGRTWSVSEPVAWDADGDLLTTWMELTEGELRVEVDTRDASLPITVDPMMTTAATTMTSSSGETNFGYAIAGIGDADGDGYDDIAIGTVSLYDYISTTAFSRNVYVHFGSGAGTASTVGATLTLSPDSFGFGGKIDRLGDINSDGFADIGVVRNYVSTWGSGCSASGVFTGRSARSFSGPYPTWGGLTTSWSGSGCYTIFTQSDISAAGDVNGDGHDDLMVSDPLWQRAYIYHGSASGLAGTASTTFPTVTPGAYVGADVAPAGDVNGDGYDDILITVPRGSVPGIEVYHGSASGLSGTASTTLTLTVYDTVSAMEGIGDVNGDGYDDVALALPTPGYTAGAIRVYHGSASGIPTAATTTLTGVLGSNFGADMAAAGDVNADGYDDIIVGSPYNTGAYTTTPAGTATIYYGGPLGLSASSSTTLTTGTAGDYFGYTVTGAGDVNGDGVDDVAVTSTRPTPAVRVYLGAATDTDGDGIPASTDCDDTSAAVGAASSRYVDADGDGYGTSATRVVCPSVPGYAATSGDCDDTRAAVHPGATEVCDAADIDEDCDGAADDADTSVTGRISSYADADGDSYGAGAATLSCDLPTGRVATATDCDDSRAAVHPGATEVCDAADTDEDCDGAADDADASVTGRGTSYRDADADGYGAGATVLACDTPTGNVATDGDCDDTRASVNPGATEVCDPDDLDEDCDGLADDADPAVTGRVASYRDADADGYGAGAASLACDVPVGRVANATDCDDADRRFSPGVAEVCNGLDDDCDAAADEGLSCEDDTGTVDTADTNDTADTDDTADTNDTADTSSSDTSSSDTSSSGTADDTGPNADDDKSASDGCGCASQAGTPFTPVASLLTLSAVVLRRRRKLGAA